ncbi:MAG TPA: hypothetical protein VI358_14645 [Pseudolabrys sp.]
MRSIDLSHPLKRLARKLASISVCTRIVVQALIPAAGSLANSLRRNHRSTELGDSVSSQRVSRASGEARVGAEAMSRVAGVMSDARSTAPGVKDLADSVAVETEGLEAQVRQFLNNIQAA